MNDTAFIAILTAVGAALLELARRGAALWATIRREDIAAGKDNAARQVAAMDRIGAAVNEHTAKDLAHHAEVKEAVVRLDAKVDSALAWLERTPITESKRTRIARTSG